MSLFKRFILEEHGLETVEYALLLGITAVGSIAFIAAIGAFVSGRFQAINDQAGLE